MKVLIIIANICFLIICQKTFCQEENVYQSLEKFPVGSALYTHYNPTKYTLSELKGELSINEFRNDLILAIPLIDKKRYFLNRPMYLQLDMKNNYNGNLTSRNFRSFSWGFGLLEKMKKDWTFIGFITPILASDFQNDISHNDFIIETSTLFYKRSNKHFEYGFGFTYSSRFGKHNVIPLISTIYKKNSWGLYMILPSYISILKDIGDSRLGITCTILRENYNFEQKEITGIDLDKIVYSRFNVGPELELKLYKSAYLNLHSGYTFLNNVSSITKEHQTGLDLNLKNRLFFTVGINILVKN